MAQTPETTFETFNYPDKITCHGLMASGVAASALEASDLESWTSDEVLNCLEVLGMIEFDLGGMVFSHHWFELGAHEGPVFGGGRGFCLLDRHRFGGCPSAVGADLCNHHGDLRFVEVRKSDGELLTRHGPHRMFDIA